MCKVRFMVIAGAALSLSACGDDGGREASDSGTASATAVTATTDSASSDASGSESETTAGPDGTGSDSEGSTTAGTTVEPSTTTDETTETTDATTGVDPTTTATDSDTDSDTDTETTDDPCQGMGGGMLDFSYIWVANSAEGTVSKINTLNMIEEGRYVVRPDSAGNPSRTSVNLRGDVAVANRFGGVAKIAARVEDCVDLNANNTIDTSTGKFDVRPWGAEECLLWYTDFPQFSVMRPMAWTAGTFNEQTCGYENQLAWTTGAVAGNPGSIHALALDGETGVVVHDVPVPEVAVGGAGPYGGAVDGQNNFWFHHRDSPPYPLVKVDGVTLQHTVYTVPDPINPYGITVDTNQRVWLAGYQGAIGRFDPINETWDVIQGYTGLGIQEDANKRMWVAKYPWGTTGAWGFDIDTLQLVGEIDLTGEASSSRGLSIDFEGNVWIVEEGARAYRVNVNNGNTWDVYDGLTGAYTYSDMTGWGLKNVIPE